MNYLNETKFKILTNTGFYVDANLLHKGIYFCSVPFIYSKNETIENMIKRAELSKDMTGKMFTPEKYFESLKQCELTEITINIKC